MGRAYNSSRGDDILKKYGVDESAPSGGQNQEDDDRARQILAKYGMGEYTDAEKGDLAAWQQLIAGTDGLYSRAARQLNRDGWRNYQNDAQFKNAIDEKVQSVEDYLKGINQGNVTYKQAKEYLKQLQQLQQGYQYRSDYYGQYASENDYNLKQKIMDQAIAQLQNTGWEGAQGDRQYEDRLNDMRRSATEYLQSLDQNSPYRQQAQANVDYLTQLQGAYQNRADFYGQFPNEDAYNAFTGLQAEYANAAENGESYDDIYRRLQAQADQERTGNRSEIDQLEARADELDQMLMNGVKTVETPQGLVNVPLTAEETQQLQQEVLQIRQERDRLKAGGYESNYAAQWARTLRYADLPARQDFLSGAEAGRAAYEANEAHAAEALEPLRGGVADNAYQFAQRSTARYAPSDLWSEQERNTFYWLWQNRGREAAVEYGEDVNISHNSQAQAEQGREHAAWAEEHPGATFAMNIAAAPWQMAEFLGKAEQVGAFGRYVPEAEMGRGTAASTMMTAVAQKLNEKGTLPEWLPAIGGKGLGDAYQLANSIAKSMATARLGGGATNLLFFGEAANSGFDEAKARGASDDQALIMGALNGAAEVIGETVSIERLVRMKSPASFKRWLVETMKQGGVEASEEVFTTLMNTVSDAVVMGDKSQLQTSIREKMAAGMSREQAEKEAWQEWFNDIAYDAVGGFLSGGVSGGLQQGGQILRASTREYSGADADRLVELALQEQEGSKARALAEKIQKQGTMSLQEATRLRELMPSQAYTIDKQTRQELESIARERLSQNGQVNAADVRAIAEYLQTGENQKYSNESVEQAANELMREQRIAENLRFKAAQKNRAAVQEENKASDRLKQAFTASNLEMSDSDLEVLASGARNEKSLDTYVLAARDAYRLGKSGMSYQQAVENSPNANKVNAINFQHAWELGYKAGGGTVEMSSKAGTHVDTSTEEGMQKVTAMLSSFGDDAGAVAALYQQGQDVETYADRMTRAAQVYAAAGADVASIAGDANLTGLTAEQMKLAQELGAKIRQQRAAQTTQASSTAIDIRQRMAEMLKGDVSLKERESLQKQLDEAEHFASQVRQDIRQQEEALEKMEDGKGRQQAEKDLAKAKDALQKLNQAIRDISKKQRQLEGKSSIQRKKGTISFDGGKIDGKEVAAVDRSKLNRAQKRVVAMVTALADAINIDYVFFQGEEGMGGAYEKGGTIYINLNAGGSQTTIAAATLAHELTHFMQEYAPTEYKELRDFVVDTILKASPAEFDRLIRQQQKWEPGKSWDYLENELVANACQEMLLNEKVITQLARQNMRLAERIQDIIANLRDKITKAFESADFNRKDVPVFDAAKAMRGSLDQLAEIWARGIARATETYNAAQAIGEEAVREIAKTNATQVGSYDLENFTEAKTEDGEQLFQIYAFEHDEDQYRTMLEKWGGMSATEIDELFNTVDTAMAKIMKNLEALDYAWEEDIDDRGFQAIKQNSDKLYKVSLDFSTLCRKRLLQGLIAGQLSAALQRGLSKEEGIAVRDALLAIQAEGKQIEVACALCYVESARMRSQKAIQEFLNDREAALRNYYANQRGRESVAKAEMDERQAIYDELVKADKAAGKPMSEWGLVRGKGDDATMYDIRDSKTAKMSKIPTALKKRIQDAKKAARAGYALTAEQKATLDYANSLPVEAFTTPEGLQELAKSKYRDIFNAFVLKVSAASKSKGIENDTWWRAGDSQAVGDALIRQMNAENGLRTQSWSDFTVKHLMDYIAATIELSTRGAKQHAYTKVLDYVDLMGRTGLMINMSLIPTRDYNGKLEYDPVEGIDFNGAMKMREKFPDTAGTICIGITVDQIRQLLDSMDIDYVIPYHASGMSKDTRKLMHIPAWENFQDYQSEKKLSGSAARENARKYGVELLSESDPLWHEGPSFSEWFDLEKARATAKRVGKTGKYGVMTGGYAAMQEAAENYKRICAQRGLAPKFSYGSAAFDADFSNDAGYWKLLIDRKMVNNKTGEIIEQRALKPTFDFETVQRILDDELKRYPGVKADQENAILRVTRAFLKGDVKAGMSSDEIAKAMQTPVDNVPITNITQNESLATVPDNANLNDTGTQLEAQEGVGLQYSRWVEDEDTLRFLDQQVKEGKVVHTYKTFLEIDGKLYPPMASMKKENGKWSMAHAMEVGRWEESVGDPSKIIVENGKGFFLLKKDNGKTLKVAYNPYQHSSNLMINDQFSSAYDRPNLVTYECLIPESELTSGYHAEYAKNTVGRMPWKSGGVANQIAKAKGIKRDVFLSRWLMPLRRVPDAEVAQHYKELLDGTDIAVPSNVVTPSLLHALEDAGVKIEYTAQAPKVQGDVQYMTWGENGNDEQTLQEHEVVTAIYDVLDHGDAGDDNLVKVGRLPKFIRDLTQLDGDFYLQRDHMYENIRTLKKAQEENRVKGNRHFHGIGEDLAVEALMSTESPAITINDNEDESNPKIVMVLPTIGKSGTPLVAVFRFYDKAPINGRFDIRPHLTVSIYEKLGEADERGTAHKDLATFVNDAVKEHRVISYNKEMSDNLPVIAQLAWLGNVTASSLNKNLTQFRKEVKDFRDKNKISYQTWSDGEVYNDRALVSEETLDKWMSGSWYGASDPNYAQAYITSMSPSQYLKLTTLYDENRILAESKGRTMDWAKEVSESQPIQLHIDTETGKVEGHEGRHRMAVLAENGITEVPVLLFDMSNKYSKKPMKELVLRGQDFHGETNISRATVLDVYPLNRTYREQIVNDYSRKTGMEKMSEKYQGKQTLQFQKFVDTDTPEFKEWFGDSKVVDEDGKPMVVYHGTEEDFTVFDRTKGRSFADIQGMFFSPWEIEAGGYGSKVGAYYLSIQNPAPEGVAYKALNRFKGENYRGVKAREYLEKLGYDGVQNYDEWIAFRPEQIKSATDNVGTFDKNNPDVRFQKWTENDDTESEKQGREAGATRLQAENAALSQTVKELKALSRKQKGSIEKLQKMLQLTRTPETRLYDARQMAKQLLADYSGTVEQETLAKQLKALGDTLLQTDTADLDEQKLKNQARGIAAGIVQSAVETATDPQVENEAGAEELQVNPYQVHAEEAVESIANRILQETMEGALRPVAPTFADKAKSKQEALRQQILSLRRENALSDKEAARLYQTVYDLSLALDKAQSRARTLRESARYREAQIHEEGLARAAEVKARERARSDRLLQAQKEYYRELAERYRERRNESAGAKKYRKQVEERAGQLYEMLMTNSDKLHVPEVLKAPLADFLESIDFTSQRALAGGQETRKDRDFGARLLRLQQMLENQQRYIDGDGSVQQDLGGYLDIGQDSMTFLRQSAEMITQAMQMSRGFTVNQMSADQLKDLAKFLQNLREAIRNMNEFMANERFASVREAADGDITEMEAMGRAPELAENRMLNDILWKNGTPYYIMKRFGEGGKSIFEGFTKGWAQMAFDAREIIDFTEKTYTDKEVKEWKNQKHEITLEDGSKVTMTTAQIMELSQLLGREQARKHIFKGGMRIGNIETKRGAKGDTTHYHLTDADIQTILGKLTDRQQKVARELQRFMADKGAEWGNEVSMKRFGYKFYEEGPGYYPIRTDANDRPMADTDAQQNSMFRLLNLSSSKSLNPRASNALIVGDIFETFASHMGDMAKLHGMGLPVLDAIKWFNYKERIEKGDGQYSTRTMQGAMEQAFGSEALSYFRTLMKDINGVTENSDRGTTFYSKAMGRFKAAAVGANLRVALLQPTAYVRAATVLKPQYMLAAFGNLHASVFSAAGAKAAWKEAMQHSGEMIWKDIGGYDTDLARTMRGQIQHDDSFMDKLVELTMLGAEWGDKLTWGRLWAACKLQAKAENKGISGSELMQKTEDLFREVIYSSQVMDSTLTRSELMRSTSVGSKMITPFMAEPTLSFNILMDAASDLRNDTRKYGRAEAWQRNVKKIGKAFAVYCMSAAAAALAESLWDAVRDDDDEEYWKKFLQALFGKENAARILGEELDENAKGVPKSAWTGNLVQDLSILGKLPVVKDVISLLSGYSSTNMATDAFKNIINAYQIWRETYDLANGTLEKPTKTTYYGNMTQWGKIYKSLQGLSQLTGLPMYGLTRDATAIWNTVMNGRKDDWKIRTYDGNALSQSKKNTYNEVVAPTGVSQKDYQRMLQEINADGNSSISQDEAGAYLQAEEAAGRLTNQQAAAIWSAATSGKKTYDEWASENRYGKGNIDLFDRDTGLYDSQGNLMTLKSISFEEDGKEILIPTIVKKNGQWVELSEQEAIDWYHRAGEYLGKFKSIEAANKYAQQLHLIQEMLYK